MKRSGSAHVFFLAALLGAVAMGACSLNAQPIPPGVQATTADGGTDFGKGGGLSSDASTSADSGTVTGNPTPGDASDDAGDAATEDSGDAATDAGDE